MHGVMHGVQLLRRAFKDATAASTDVEFTSGGVGYTITFTATPPEGSTDVAQTGTTTVTIGQLAAKITAKQTKGLLYSFTADTSNTGLPDTGVTYAWSVNDNPIGTGSSKDYLFAKANTQYRVSLSTKIGDSVIGSNSLAVTTGDVINPSLTATQDGANPLAYTVTADETATNIGSDWSRVWSIDGKAVEGASTAKLDHTFDLTAHKYTVSYVASKEGYTDRTASIDVTTKAATKPTVTATPSQDNPLSYAVNADLTNTGITAAWSYAWSSSPEATFKDATAASTDVEFTSGGVGYTITFTATPPEGSTDVAQTGTTTVTIGQLAAKITAKQTKGLLYSFTADTSNTGLPDTGVTYAWSVNDNPIGTGSSKDYLFAKANTQYIVSLSTKIGDSVIGSNSLAVTTGDVINPSLTATQDGANPLAYTVTADETATNIGSDWSRVWSIDGKAVEGASTAKLDHTFDLTAHKYTVSYVASKEGYTDRTASIDVTTKAATKPTVTATPSQDNPLSYAVNADLTNTGITDAWSYAWSSSPEATFKDATAASTDVEFTSGGVGYTITFTATPPEGSTDVAQTGTTTVTIGQLAAKITAKQTKGLLYSFTADTSNTGLPDTGVTYAWSVNDNPIGTGSSKDYLFAKANTKYIVSLSTKIGDSVIGSNSLAVTTGDVINPSLTATQDGANPLAYTVTADETATNIGSDWSRVWSIDGKAVEGASTAKLDHTFDLTAHKYTVSYVASKEGYTDRTASIDVTTKAATKPTVTATPSQDNPLSYAVNADLTNTGITAAWSYAWSSSPEATFKDATAASTDVEFTSGGVGYTITFTATPPEGSTDVAQTGTTTVTIGQLAAKITAKQTKGLLYSFTADTSNTGLPKDGVTYAWSVNDNPIGTGSSTDYLFAKANTQYRVSLSTKIGDSVIGSNSLAVTTGDVINPSLTATQDGANPLAYTVTADETATNIGSDWSRVWSIDGKAVEGASTAKLDHTFDLTAHKYTVSYVASKEGYTDRTASIDVTTKAATKPTVTATPSQDNPLSYAVNADLTNTGITDAWSYAWSSSPEASFKDATAATTEVEFTSGGVGYTITFTATPPEGSTDVAQTGTTTVTIGQLAAKITAKQTKGLLYSFTADTSNTGLPDTGVTYAWSVNDNPIGTGSSKDYLFAKANTQYIVSLSTKVGDSVIGSNSLAVTTGDVINPSLTATQDGANPLAYTVTADETATNIGSDWSRVWSIDGKAVEGASTAKLDHTFDLTAHKYTVSYVASKEGYTDRTASIDVTTKAATKPTVTATPSQDNPLSYAVNADLTNTGITDAWSYAWSSTPEASFKDATAATTEVEFAKGGVAYTITFTATPPEGSTDVAQTGTTTVTIGQLAAKITAKQTKGLLYSFTADTSNTGLPDTGVTYAWSVNDNPIGTGSSKDYLFAKANTKYIVSLSTKVGDSVIGSNSLAVTTGDVINPSLTATQDGANPLAYTVTADETATNIGSDWSRVWSIDGKAVEGASTAKLDHTFDLTAHKYTVVFTATSPQGVVRINTVDVTTGAATAPKLSSSAGSSDLNFNVKADLTDTGITAAWSYQWSSTPWARFADSTKATTDVEFASGGVAYTITFTATPPAGSSDKAQTATGTITTKMLPARITSKKVNGTKYEFSANTSGTGLPNEGVTYVWTLSNRWSLGTGSSIDFLFNSAQTTYRVELTTKIGNKTIGTTEVSVTTGDAVLPKVTASKDGSNPLVWTVKADVDGTNVNDDWTRQWYIDGKAVKGATNTYTLDSYEFALTDHKYEVEFAATNTLPDGVTTDPVTRSATITVTTGAATAPKLSSSAGSSDLNFNVKADLTDTGITDAWSYGWTSTPSATFADSTKATTSVDLPSYGTSYDLTFTATPPKGSSDKAQTATETITTKMLPAKITSKNVNGTKYEFSANTSGTGLPNEGVTYVWTLLNKWSLGTGSSIDFLFYSSQTTYEVELTTKIGNKTIGTTEVDVTTGDAVLPKVTASKDGSNPLVWTVKADVGGTNVNSSWSRQWYIDGKAVKGATNTYTLDSYEFALTDHKYEVEFAATNTLPDGVTTDPVTRSATITVTTGAATAPKLSSSAGSSDLNFNVKADLTDTGITDAWSYGWTSTPSATFADSTKATTSVDLPSYGTSYDLTFTATPPKGSSDKAQTVTETITTKMLPAKITSKNVNGTKYEFSANTSGTGLPNEGVTYAWSVNGNSIGSGSSIAYLFAKANTKYTVILSTKIGDSVIGTNSTTVTTGEVINPTLSAKQDGADPLAYTVMAATTGTNIGSGWTYKWSGGDGVTFITATGTIASAGDSVSTGVDFALTAHKYTVVFTATSPQGVVRTNSVDVTTGAATAPKLSSSAGSSDLNFNVKADLTDTGITDAWSYGWTSTPSATFADSTKATTSVDLPSYGTSYDLTFTATPPEGSSDKAQTATETITTKMLPATITYKNVNGTKYEFSANTSGTGLPNEGVTYVWTLLNRWSLGTGSSIDFLFYSSQTTYEVELTTKIGNKTIGTTEVDVTTGDAVLPKVTASKDGSNPLVWTVKADVGGTNVNDDWTRQWYIDGKAVKGATNTYTLDSYEFALTDHKYEVEFAATNTLPDGVTTDPVTRSATITVTTGAATAPKLSSSAGSSDLNFNVKADLTDTGITDAWSYGWTSTPSATFADSTKATTSVDLPSYGTSYDLTFTATPPKGSSDKAQTATETITTKMLPAKITSKNVNGTKYEFSANTSGTGLPNEGVTYVWTLLNRWSLGTGSSIDFLFNSAQTTYRVELTTKIGNKTIGTTEVDVTTGDAVLPKVTASKDGSNPLVWTVKADVGGTNVNSSWTRQWYIDGKAVKGATNTYTLDSYEFALTDHKYEVEFAATNTLPDGVTTDPVTRSATITVTTGAATAPKLSSSAGSSDLNFNVKADLTDTGITDAWSYGWTSTPSATFADSTKATTSVDLPSYGTSYDLTFTATPPEGSSDKAQTATETITTKMLAATITSKNVNGTKYEFSANTSGTGLPNEGVTYAWSVNGNSIGSGSSIAYLFAKANTKYTVSLSTKVGDSVIGTNSIVVTTGEVINPTLSAKQAGADPLAYTVTAATTSTNIGSGWTYKWSGGDGVTFTTATGTIASAGDSVSTGVDFALTAHKYTVVFTATSPQGVVRTNSVDVTTGAATAPKLSSSAGSSDLNFNVKADLTDTGITDAWSYGWTSTPSATFADSTKATTSVDLPSYGTSYDLTFTATPPEGSSDKAQTATETITTKMLPARITSKNVNGTKYEFSANTSGTGLPNEGVTYVWTLLNRWSLGTGSSIDFLFYSSQTTYEVELTTKIGNKTIGTTEVDVTTGDAVLPKVTASKDGSNPLVWTVKADVGGTNVNDDWTRQWYIDGKAVKGATNTYTLDSYEFALTDHKYEVEFAATNTLPDGVTTDPVTRSATITVTTGAATAPKLSSSAGSSDLNFNVKADLTDTGITDAWSYGWTSTPSATFADSTKATTSVDLPSYGTSYDLTFTATPPKGSSDKAQTATETITTKMLPATITSKNVNGTKYEFSANTSGTGLPNEGVTYVWTLLNKWSLGTGSSIDFLFNSAQTTYEVELTTKIGNKTIGTTEVDVTTGDAVLPKVTASKDGSNPLVWTVKADVGGTNVNDDWTRQWYVDGKAVKGATNTYTLDSYEFALTDHKYEVEFAATNTLPDGVTTDPVTRSATITVTTGAATAPKLSSSAGSSDLNFNVKADLTDTGITDAWSYGWTSTPSATFADSTKATTSVDLPSYGTSYDLTFTATPPEGSSDKAQTATETITTKMLPARITSKNVNGTKYEFSANTSGTGLPNEGVTYAWSVNGNSIGSGSSIAYLFAKANTQYTVSLSTKIGDKVIGTNSVAVTTGDVINPTLSAKQDGADPLAYTVTAATTGTNIGSGWTYKWSGGDGVTFTTATGTISSAGDSVSTGVDFALTAHKYTVVFTATSPQGVVRTNSVDVTTGAATAPKLSSSAGSSDLNFNVKADLTDTGITDAWSYGWTSTPSATFADSTKATTSVDLPSYGTSYDLTFTATPPEGSSDKAQTATETITTKMLPATITYKNVNGTKYEFSANTSGTGLPNEGVTYAWSVNGNSIGSGSSIAYLFAKADTKYTVSLSTKVGDSVIGYN